MQRRSPLVQQVVGLALKARDDQEVERDQGDRADDPQHELLDRAAERQPGAPSSRAASNSSSRTDMRRARNRIVPKPSSRQMMTLMTEGIARLALPSQSRARAPRCSPRSATLKGPLYS